MMDKSKRKGQANHPKNYWLIFGLVAIVLMIPFRVMEHWFLTNAIYLAISVIIGIVIVRFISRYGWKQWILVLMLICAVLPFFQVSINEKWAFCEYRSEQGIVRTVRCSEGCETDQHMLALGTLPISIQTYFGRYIPYCLT